MWPQTSKETLLAPSRTAVGVEQRAHFVHAELHDESIVELESPMAALARVDTLVFTFLVLGDQNAGKSTFLHSFSHHNDEHFTELLCTLPVLSASFVNARFADPQAQSVLDEPPFLDTDQARATVLVTREDFVFWLEERGLLGTVDSRALSQVSYVLLHLVELGGDHLDALMDSRSVVSEAQRSVLDESRRLLRSALASLYFVNVSTLLNSSSRLVPERIAQLDARLTFLSSAVAASPSAPHSVLLCLSRCPKDLVLSPPQSLEDVLSISLAPFLCPPSPLRIVAVRRVATLTPNGSLDFAQVFDTLAALFAHQLTLESDGNVDAMVAMHIVACHRELLGDPALEVPGVDLEDFETYLEAHHSTLELPPPLALQRFASVAQRLSQPPLRLGSRVFGRERLGDISVRFVPLEGSLLGGLTWRRAQSATSEWALRLPRDSALLDDLELHMRHGGDAAQWLTQGVQINAATLDVALQRAELSVHSCWQKWNSDPTSDLDWLRLCAALDEFSIVATLAHVPLALKDDFPCERKAWDQLQEMCQSSEESDSRSVTLRLHVKHTVS